MEFISSDDLREIPPLPDRYHAHFTGTTALRELPAGSSPDDAGVLLVRFEPGARNGWHLHTGGQLLFVTEGEGYVQARGEAPVLVRAGDAVSCPPDEEHWHGATPEGPGMTHLAVTYGKIVWLDGQVDDDGR
ncbi:cupin domain-containing protein [Umezawaea endophytica]|uniref:Cupin domain-containing protein n=1 Tax=Umezawaea endophytica TaxID=1654476 RepID=A0A9X2VQI3_9PSEU|nr:cupin domain-containing protein [Umezawaea endophytica]MCS7480477.1 cupin domain-containing protein [Umezawaea endophytica]